MLVAGVDFSTYAVTVAALPFDSNEPILHTIPLRKARDSGEDFGLLALRDLEPLLVSLDSFWRECGVVWLERGYGASRRGDYTLGAVLGALLATLPTICDAEVNILTLGEWRKALCGSGNAPKQRVLPALRDLGFTQELNGDEADALGIAWVGRELNRRALAA